MKTDDRPVFVSLADAMAMIDAIADDAREEGLCPEAVAAMKSLADVPEGHRAHVVALLVRLGTQFRHAVNRAAETKKSDDSRWN